MIPGNPIVPSWLAETKAAPAARPAEAAVPQAERELRRIAGDFESVFSKMLLASMRKTVEKSPLFHAGRGEEIFSELLDHQYSEAVSKRGKGLGIADMIVKKYVAHVKAQEEQKGRNLDTGKEDSPVPPPGSDSSVAPAGKAARHD